jgi:RNA polymerase sigma-70 factor (ECF subfamily)
LTDCTDEELFARFCAGEQDLFGTLIRRYERELYGYLRRYLDDEHLADDVFQNTFLQVFLKRDQYETGRPVRPWLYAIATNQAIDAMRRAGRHPAASLDQTMSDTGDGEVRSLLELLESPEAGPNDLAIAGEQRDLVRAAVRQLPDFLRQVLILTYYQGLKYREVADILGIPVGTVKSRLHAALLKLHEAYAAPPTTGETR